MKQYSVKEMQRILKHNGYEKVRQRSSHQIWQRDSDSLCLPVATLHSVIALRLIKEHSLSV